MEDPVPNDRPPVTHDPVVLHLVRVRHDAESEHPPRGDPAMPSPIDVFVTHGAFLGAYPLSMRYRTYGGRDE